MASVLVSKLSSPGLIAADWGHCVVVFGKTL